MKFLIITLYIFNSFLFTCAFCASIIFLLYVCGTVLYVVLFTFLVNGRSVSWFPHRDETTRRPKTLNIER